MLTAIREGSKGWIAYIVIGLIVLTFALFGISSYLEGDSEMPVATVNGEEIDLYTYQNELAQQRQALLSRFGGDFDPALLDTLGIKDRVVDSLIESRLLAQYANERNYRLSDSQLAERIQGNTMFQTDGKFDPARYASILESSRMTPQGYEAAERQNSALGQLLEAVQESAFTIDSEVDRLLRLQGQRRDVSYAVIPAASFIDEFEITDEEAQKKYEANIDQYQREARIKVQYIDLGVDSIAESIEPTEDDIAQTYARLKGRFMTPDIRKASHILFAIEADADEATRAARLETAEATLSELQGGADFAELAKARSDDTGSATNGGELGVVARGQMVKPFEDAVFSLEEGGLSGIVETQFGLHIIKLTELTEGEQKSLDEVRDVVAADARKAMAEETFADLVEPFQNLVFEQPDSLLPAADELGLKVETSDWFTLAGGGVEDDSIAAESAVRRAAFAEDVLEDNLNSQVIELGFDRVVALRKAEFEPAAPLPFEEVKERIVTDLKLQKSAAKVEQVATEALQGLTHAASFDIMLANNEWSEKTLAPRRDEIEPQDSALAEAVYAETAPENDQPRFGQVTLPDGDVAVYALLSVEAGDPDAADEAAREQIVRQLEARDGVGAYRQLLSFLRDQADVVVDREQL